MKRKVVYDYQIDGSAILTPDQDIEVTLTDIYSSDSGIDESGVEHGVLIRPNVHTWKLKYAFLTEEEFRYMMALFKGEVASAKAMSKHIDRGMSKFEFSYYDEKWGYSDFVSCTAYCKDVTYTHRNRNGLYVNVTFTIRER